MSVDWDARDLEVENLRRHWRALGLAAAWGATIRLQLGSMLAQASEAMLRPHVAPHTRARFEDFMYSLAADFDTANEGLMERKEIEYG